MIKEFKEFIMRGSVLDLAVGVVIGGAFTAIVNGVVEGLITPLISLIVVLLTGKTDMDAATSALDWTVRKGVTFQFGHVVSALITFLITGFVLFLIVKAANKMKDKALKKDGEEDDDDDEIEIVTTESLLKDIRELLEDKFEEPEDVVKAKEAAKAAAEKTAE